MVSSKLIFEEVKSPLGPILILGKDDYVLRIDFGTMVTLEEKLTKWGNRYFNDIKFINEKGRYPNVAKQLDEYFTKERKEFSLNFKLFGTPFQQRVWKALYETTHFGETKTYQDLAVEINHPKAVRAIGGAMNKNPISIVVPCHRVIGKNGKLVGYGGGIDKKEFLLQHESDELRSINQA